MGVLPLKSGSYNAEQGRGGMLMDDILQVNGAAARPDMGRAHADSAAWHRIVLHGGDRSFFRCGTARSGCEKTLFSCFTGAARRTSGGVSPFAAICTALAATVGTGNIAGVATALTLGGPGAVLWLWVSAFVGMMTAFCGECARHALPRAGERTAAGAANHAVPEKRSAQSAMAGAFALFFVLASFGIGNMSQCNSIAPGTFRLVRHTERDRRRGDSGFARRGASRRPQTAVPRDGNTRAVHGAVVLHGRRGRCAGMHRARICRRRSRRFARWRSIRQARAACSATA